MSDSMEMTILSVLGPALHCDWGISRYQQALVTTVVFLGMMLSSTFWGHLSDRYGRKPALSLCGVLLFLYGLLSAVAPSLGWLLLLRGLVGFAIGCVPQSVTLYAEFLPTKQRGKCVVLLDCFWALGACFEVVLAMAVVPNLGWRWLLGISAAPLFVFACLTPVRRVLLIFLFYDFLNFFFIFFSGFLKALDITYHVVKMIKLLLHWKQ